MGPTLKVLFFIDDLGSGGAQRQMAEMAFGFRETGAEVCFLIYHDTIFYKELEQHFHIEIIEEGNYLKRFWRLRRYIRSGDFDVVLSFLPSPNMISCLTGLPSRRWKVIVGERSANPAMMVNAACKIKLKTYVLADNIVSNSRTNLQMVARVIPRYPTERMKVVYNIVDFSRFHPTGTSYGPDKLVKVVVASRHHHLKNLDGLIEAVRLLPVDARERLRIEWFGDKGADDSLEKGMNKLAAYGLDGIFAFFPPVKEIERVYAGADAVGLFSFYEGLPNAVCEGMAMGKPVIASAVSDVPLLISEHRLLCDPTDPGSIAASLAYLLSLPAEQLEKVGKENHERALELFDRKHILNQYLELMKQP